MIRPSFLVMLSAGAEALSELQLTLMGGAIAVALRGTVWPCWFCLTHQLNLDNPQ